MFMCMRLSGDGYWTVTECDQEGCPEKDTPGCPRKDGYANRGTGATREGQKPLPDALELEV